MLKAFYPNSLALSGSIGYGKKLFIQASIRCIQFNSCTKITTYTCQRSQMFRYPLVLLFNQCVTVLHDVWLILSQLQD